MANEQTSGYDRAMELIEREYVERTGTLDLGMLGLREIPEEVFGMAWLKSLNISNFFRAGSYTISKYVDGPNEFIALPSRLDELVYLTSFNCSNTGVKHIEPIAGLESLINLDLSMNPLKSYFPLSKLNRLYKLYLNAVNLISLHQIPFLRSLGGLEVDNNSLEGLDGLVNFPKLWYFSARQNGVVDISPLIGTNLHRVNLEDNLVQKIPYEIVKQLSKAASKLIERGDFRLNGNPLQTPPLEICQQGRRAMLDWYESINPELSEEKAAEMKEFGPEIGAKRREIRSRNLAEKNWQNQPSGVLNPNRSSLIPANLEKEELKEGTSAQAQPEATPLNEAKILLIGDGAAGKTSLVKQFFGEPFDPAEPKTDGILIRQHGIALEDGEVNARFWDFGGQEIMHATHRFFLSRRSLYVVVLDARKDDDRVEYWLNHVRTYGGDSPVLVVVNKVDENPAFQLNNRYLQEKYPNNIKGFHRISCLTSEGIQDLQQAMELELFHLEFRKLLLADSWRAVKSFLELHDTDFISYDRYREICRNHEVIKLSHQDTLLGFLNALGIVLHFEELNHFNTQVLNPLWLTNAVYRLINANSIAEQHGLFGHTDMDAILNVPNESNLVYPPEKFRFLALVMQEFELAYKVEGTEEESYLIPELLPVPEPEIDFPEEGAVQLRLEYRKMLPPSLLPRFIVRMHPWVKEGCQWRTGVVLQHESMNALTRVRLDKLERCIRINAVGEGARRMMSFVRDTFLDLHEEFKELDWEELVPVRDTQETVEYSQLTEMERQGETEIYVKGIGRIPVAELLNGIESPLRRTKHEPMINVFVSYSHAYPEHKQKLLTFLSPYIRANEIKDIWDDSQLVPGKRWDDAIWEAHAEANLVICLLSPEFLQSDYCYEKEFKLALENETQEVVCIVVEDCLWHKLKPLADLQTIAAGKAISAYDNVNQGWKAAMMELDKLIETMK